MFRHLIDVPIALIDEFLGKVKKYYILLILRMILLRGVVVSLSSLE